MFYFRNISRRDLVTPQDPRREFVLRYCYYDDCNAHLEIQSFVPQPIVIVHNIFHDGWKRITLKDE